MPIAPLVGAGLITGGAGLLGSLFGASSSAKGAKYAAEKALEATRETNAQNYKIWQEQRQYAIDAWNAENAYNTPEAQRARLEAAGYNPYLAFGDVGNTGGTISQPAAPQMVAPPESAFPNTQGIFAQGLNNAFQNALQVLSSAVQMQNVTANTNKTNQDIEQQGKMFPFLLDTSKYGSISAKFNSEADEYLPKMTYEDYQAKKRENYIGELTKDLQIETVGATLQQIKAQTSLMKLNAEAQETLNKYLDQNQQLELMTKAQTLYNLYQDGRIKKQQLQNLIAQEILTYSQARGQNLQNYNQALQNSYDAQTLNDRVNQAHSESQIAATNAEYAPYNAQEQLFSAALSNRIAKQTAGAIINQLNIEYGNTGSWVDPLLQGSRGAGAVVRGIGGGIIGGK